VTQIAVVGHIEWVEFIRVPRLPRAGEVEHAGASFARAAGGGGVVAGVLAELGAEVDFFTALGRDRPGQASVAQLAERGVLMHVAAREQPTRRAVTLLDDAGERTIITIGERLEPSAGDELEWARLDGADGAYVTAGDAGALVHARAARVLVASPRARNALTSEGPLIDALVYSARDRDEREWAQRVGNRARLQVATDGVRGGRWWGESEGSWKAVALAGEPRDSYGAGDAFAAAFTFALAAREPVERAVALGAEWGARMLTRPGAP
jgi:ribokinase